MPDLAMDALGAAAAAVMPLEAAGKLFVLATFLLLAGGVALLHRVLFGRWSAWPCLAFLLLYNRLLLWGIAQLSVRPRPRVLCARGDAGAGAARRGLRLAAGAVFALALYFAHLMAFGVYAVLLARRRGGGVAARAARGVFAARRGRGGAVRCCRSR